MSNCRLNSLQIEVLPAYEIVFDKLDQFPYGFLFLRVYFLVRHSHYEIATGVSRGRRNVLMSHFDT